VLEELLVQVEAQRSQVVGIVGDAGVGKSRLLYEFRQYLAGKRITYLEGRCLSYGQAMPYRPFIEALRQRCGLMESDSPEAVVEKVYTALQEVGMEPAASAPYLLQLLGLQAGTEPLATLTPETIKARTFAALRQMSLNGSQRQPLVLAIEDLHWSDKISEEFCDTLVESLAGAAIMVLATYRPWYHLLWIDKPYVTQLALQGLAPHEDVLVVRSTQQRGTLPEAVVQMILDKAEGNPFFLEELTCAVLEHGELRADLAMPDTVQGVLMARIDRLPEAATRLLQAAAVLGWGMLSTSARSDLGWPREAGAAAPGAAAAGVSLCAYRGGGADLRLQACLDTGGSIRDPPDHAPPDAARRCWASTGAALCRAVGGCL